MRSPSPFTLILSIITIVLCISPLVQASTCPCAEYACTEYNYDNGELTTISHGVLNLQNQGKYLVVAGGGCPETCDTVATADVCILIKSNLFVGEGNDFYAGTLTMEAFDYPACSLTINPTLSTGFQLIISYPLENLPSTAVFDHYQCSECPGGVCRL